MKRRDTIIIAVLINTGFLALLFMMATGADIEALNSIEPIDHALVEAERNAQKLEKTSQVSSRDELDQVLQNYTAKQDEVPDEPQDEVIEEAPRQNYVEVTVKRGDVLEKIARTNGTTIAAIKRANNLQNEKLSIGQVLKIPLSEKKPIAAVDKSSSNVELYTLKPGDNPSKIAKKFNIRTDQLLKLNNLDEAKARNLKPGDTLRVK